MNLGNITEAGDKEETNSPAKLKEQSLELGIKNFGMNKKQLKVTVIDHLKKLKIIHNMNQDKLKKTSKSTLTKHGRSKTLMGKGSPDKIKRRHLP